MRQFQRAFNLTDVLGRGVIDNCGVLVRNEAKVLRVLAGTDKCTFHDYETARITFSTCMDTAREKRDFRCGGISFKEMPIANFYYRCSRCYYKYSTQVPDLTSFWQ